jgi:small subunit ribosomal protein S1
LAEKKSNSKKKAVGKKTAKKSVKDKKAAAPKRKISKGAKAKSPKSLRKKEPVRQAQAEPQTMEELLAQAGYEIRGLKRGSVLEGTITEKSRRALFIDIGAKTEGIVFDRELKEARDLVRELEVGDKISVMVTQPENDSGQIVLSLKRAALDRAWAFFEEKLKTSEPFEVQGREMNKGGLIVNTRGLQGFIPSSQFSRDLVGKINTLMGKMVKVKIIEVDRAKNRLILSERAVSEAEMLAAQKEVLEKVKVGEVFEGKITAVMPFGFFVKVNLGKGKKATFLEGLVHISEISWERVGEIGEFGKVGDGAKVKVLAIDEKSGKLNLSLKQLTPDPWEGIEKGYTKDKKAKGKVNRVTPFGVFVTLKPGIEGLVHISKIPAGASYKVGEEIECFVDSIDPENRRMSLGVVLKEKPVGYK